MSFKVFKFGGTSLGSPEALQKVIAIVGQQKTGLCVVVSACSGVTDSLYQLHSHSVQGQTTEPLLHAIEERHLELVRGLNLTLERRDRIEGIVRKTVEDLRKISQSLAILGEATPRTLSKTVSFGERLMAALLTEALQEENHASVLVDSVKLIKLSRERDEYTPDERWSRMATQAELVPQLKQGRIAIVPGFFGEGPDGEIMILGRGGSDYSATLLGSYIEAAEVVLYKEVDGIMTADPRHVFEARVLPELHYREATELAFYGAKVLHPRAIIPLVPQKIPLVVKSTYFPDKPGTRITGFPAESSFPVKALSYIDKQALIAIEGKGMVGVPGIASKAFEAMSKHSIPISFITQASSEASISFVVPGDQGSVAKKALEMAFRFEIENHLIDDVKLKTHVAVLALVGLGMRGTPGIAARTFSCIARQNINVIAIAQGSSELNISILLEQTEATRALRSLHKEYGLEKLRATPHRDPRELNLTLFGFGQIGQTLARQLMDQKDYLDQRLKLRCPIVGLADRSGVVLSEQGFQEDEIQEFLKMKSDRQKLRSDRQLERTQHHDIWQGPWDRRVFIDLTATDSYPLIKQALENGFHVVLANKKPLAVPYQQYRELMDLADAKNLFLLHEATVGAGLPVLDTIDKLAIAGDPVQEILGCFSGTLGYLMSELEDGTAFSAAVRQAYEKGYTEPDPRDDLSGMDVARKALILARNIGLRLDIEDIALQPLFPDELGSDDPETFLQNIRELDREWDERIRAAKGRGNALRYVARISRERVTVGVEEISKEAPLGRLRGTDNQVSLRTLRYDSNPLIVTGPGAGSGVTAAGVLNDIITIASSWELEETL